MKKLYVSALMLSISVASFAQQAIEKFPSKIARDASTIMARQANQPGHNVLAGGDTVFYSDFSLPNDWTINSPAPNGWAIQSTPSGWFLPAINSTSGGNFAELVNGDPTTNSPAPQSGTYNITTANPIDVSGMGNIVLRFEQYGAKFQDIQQVLVSTDGNQFIPIGDNSNKEPLTANSGSAYPNAEVREFSITCITGAATQLWVRFEWRPDVQNITYGWMIDDVLVYEAPDHLLELNAANYDGVFTNLELEYDMIPGVQAAANPLNFEGAFKNSGAVDQTNTKIMVDVDMGGNSVYMDSSSAGFTSVVCSADTIAGAPSFSPAVSGLYNVTLWGKSDFVSMTTNVVQKSFMVTDTVYGRDNDSPNGNWDLGNPKGGYELGHLMDIYADADATSISVHLDGTDDETVAGTLVQATIYDPSDFTTVIAESDAYNVTAGDITNGWLTLPLTTVPNLTAGSTVLVAIKGFMSTADSSAVSTSGTVPDQTSFLHDVDGAFGSVDTWYFINASPMVRLNMSSPCDGFQLTASATMASTTTAMDGTATANPTGGTSPYTYAWDDGANQTTATASGLDDGMYTVTVTDNNGCELTASTTVEVVGCATFAISATSTDASNTTTDDGTATAVVDAGGTSPYTFMWDSNAGGQTNATATGLGSGNYGVTSTDANGCTATTNTDVEVVGCATFAATASSTEASTTTTADGTATATVTSGGTSPYTYMWDSNANNQVTATATGLTQGSYSVTVTDVNGCTTTASTSVEVGGCSTLSVSASATDASSPTVMDGTVTASVTGGTTPYSYEWDDSNSQTTQTATGLGAGIYTVTVTDANGCTASDYDEVMETPCSVTVSVSETGPSSATAADGTATATASGGTTPYSYEWNDSNSQTTATATGLTAGSYSVTVTDAVGCTANSSTTLVGIANVNNSNGVKVFPNPAENTLTITSSTSVTEQVNIQILDVTGRIISTSGQMINGNMNVSVNNLAAGSYSMRIVGTTINTNVNFIKK